MPQKIIGYEMKKIHESELPDSWITPPANQGQMVEISYGDSYDGKGWQRIYDRSDRTVNYAICNMLDCGCEGECDCWDQANEEPSNKVFHFEPVEII